MYADVTVQGTSYRGVQLGDSVWVNLTPHVISIQKRDGTLQQFPKCGYTARVLERKAPQFHLKDVPFPVMARPVPERVIGLPPPQDGVFYIVSKILLDHPVVAGRADVFAPDSGPTAVRNRRGVIEYATHLLSATHVANITSALQPEGASRRTRRSRPHTQ
jgi:hypothetical protein